jgi:hypothetical protein
MNRFYKNAHSAIAGLAILASGCATTGENLVNTGVSAVVIPGRIIESTVKELDPVKGLRRGTVNTVEGVYKTFANQEVVRPDKLGEANVYIEDRPVLEALTDMTAGFGVGYGITAWKGYDGWTAARVGGWSALGEGVIKAGHQYLNK